MTTDDVSILRVDLHELETRLARELGEIKSLLDTESQRCPYRESISKIPDIADRTRTLEQVVQQGRVDSARAGATGGGVVALTGGVVAMLGKVLGWW
jgi:hypothetical protein